MPTGINIGALKASLGVDISELRSKTIEAGNYFKRYSDTVEKHIKNVDRTIEKHNATLRSVKKNASGVIGAGNYFKTYSGMVSAEVDKVDQKLKSSGGAFNGFVKTVRAAALGYFTVLGTMELINFATGVIQAGKELDSLERTFKAITGSTELAAKEMEFIGGIANKYGLELTSLEQSYKGLLASTKETNLEGEETKRLFEVMSGTAAVLGMSVDDTRGSLRAFIQMISKGNVQAEELRGQLGERLYGAFRLAAKGMGVSTQGLNKMLERGEVLADDLIPKIVNVLEKEYGPAMEEAGDRSEASFIRLTNAITRLQRGIAESGVIDLFAELAVETTKWVEANDELLKQNIAIVFKTIAVGGKAALATIAGFANKLEQIHRLFDALGIGELIDVSFGIGITEIETIENKIKNLQVTKGQTLAYFGDTSEIDQQITILEKLLKKAKEVEEYKKLSSETTDPFAGLTPDWDWDKEEVKTEINEIEKYFRDLKIEGVLDSFFKDLEKAEEEIGKVSKEFKKLFEPVGLTDLEREEKFWKNLEKEYEEKEQLEEDLTKTIKQNTSDQFAYRNWTLNKEVAALREKYANEKETLDLISEYYKTTYDEILKDKEEFEEKQTKDTETMTNEMRDAIVGWGSQWSSTMWNAMKESDNAFDAILESFIDMLGEMVIQMMIVKPFMESMFGDENGSGGILGNLFKGIFSMFSMGGAGMGGGATGGLGGATTNAPIGLSGAMGIYAGGGIATYEGKRPLPAVVHEGEVIGTPEQMEGIYGGGGSKGVSNYNIAITAMDSESFVEFTRRNPQAIIQPVESALRNRGSIRGTIMETTR